MDVANSGFRLKGSACGMTDLSFSRTGSYRTITFTSVLPENIPPVPNLSVYRESSFEEVLNLALEEWNDKDSMAIVSDGDRIHQVRLALKDGCNSKDASKHALELADYLLLYNEVHMAYYFYHVVVNYCFYNKLLKEAVLHEALLQIAKLIVTGDVGVDTERCDPNVANAIFIWLVDKFECPEAMSYYFHT
jgi:hypothetical protein